MIYAATLSFAGRLVGLVEVYWGYYYTGSLMETEALIE